MVARILRLKLRILANSFRRTRRGNLAFILWTLAGATSAAGAVWVAGNLRNVLVVDLPQLLTIGGSLLVGLSFIIPIFLRGTALDPRQFAMYPASRGRIATGLWMAALLSLPTLMLVVALLGSLVMWLDDSLALTIAAISVLLVTLAAVLSARIATSIAAYIFSSRRARDGLNVIAGLLLLGMLPLIFVLTTLNWATEGRAFLTEVATVLAWTPLGSGFSAPLEAAVGETTDALIHLGMSAGYVVVLAVLWRLLVGSMMTRISRPARPGIVRSGLGWFDRLVPTVAGVIGARSVTYWIRDPRYRVSLAVIPFVPVAMIIPLLVAGADARYMALIPLPVACLFLSWFVHNDVAWDSTAIWTHVSAATRGIDDRRGRLLPVLLLGVPLVVIGSTVSVYFYDDWRVLPATIGVSSCVLLVGSGVSSLFSVLLPYAATRPGDSPFVQPQSAGTRAGLSQLASLLCTLLLSSPVAVLGCIAVFDDESYNLYTIVGGFLWGLVVLLVGIFAGGKLFDRRAAELLTVAQLSD
ncbi:hypothetical protein GCM10022198_17460 [Klugiella xanthotipulae]|uniref:ABC-2 type transport system permease protein n=1 Tax=Klugiella xanthotipulae TaxID=244735 RepID=A0A543HXX2_9MICO|nr:hypothetical protein [Klugiella xanthotipulae]TQM63085.1 ABC-2 type transport system permease protein [Klugiella xanthotipulae]